VTLVPGTKLGPYEVVGPLGAGGMGEVFRARDTRLGRDVAIKGLPAAFAQNPERLARFQREARLLASLSHANVAGIFGLEEADGATYLVLELVEGETLTTRLVRGPLPVREALDVAVQVAAAVEAAHEKGIVHRDLKPGNIMLTPSRTVKVLDFGLAKGGATENPSSVDMSASPTMALSATGAGVILGTASYMSPEQARGRVVDRRADVWAFGCVLFECLCARQVFGGDTVSDVMVRVLEREPDWNALPVAAPTKLVDLLRRCLLKDPETRPADIGALRAELAAMALEMASSAGSRPSGAMAAVQTAPSLAVLYFENLSPDSESDYFCAGITEDILTDLSKIKGLRVASRNGVARYRGKDVDLATVASELNVSTVLQGSVRRAGERMRISVQLSNAADGFQVWAERYDRTMEDVFAVQEEIAAAITEALRVALSPAEAANLLKHRPRDAAAYDLYLQGRERYSRYEKSTLVEALELFRQATQIDADYALAWAGMADCYAQFRQWGVDGDPAEFQRLGLDAARHAISLNPRLPEGHKAEALNLLFSGDREGAHAALLRAIEADPHFTPALSNLCVFAVAAGNVAKAERYVRRVSVLDPQDAFSLGWVAMITGLTRRHDECLALTRRIRELGDSSFFRTFAYAERARLHLESGDVAAAAADAREADADGAREVDLRAIQCGIAAFEGRVEDARRLLPGLLGNTGLTSQAMVIALMAALRVGDRETAMTIAQHRMLAEFIHVFPRLLPSLHGLLDHPGMAPRRLDATLVWPLEAPMLDAAVFRLFRDVKIESGLPEGSVV
jgi:serine/threonine protein kinase/tetratricopeptide (TPR) repeat protein